MTAISTSAQPAAIVLAGGAAVDARLASRLPSDATVIAADSGLASAGPLGLTVDLIVGDLDSVEPELLAGARAAGVPIDAHPPDKDRTDLALALDAAMQADAARILVVGGHGGRLDHLLGNAALLASPTYRDAEVVAYMGTAIVTVLHGAAERTTTLAGEIGDYVSLVAFHGPARGISTTGLRFPLDDADLAAGSSLGVSNEFAAPQATVSLRDGALLAIQP